MGRKKDEEEKKQNYAELDLKGRRPVCEWQHQRGPFVHYSISAVMALPQLNGTAAAKREGSLGLARFTVCDTSKAVYAD